MSSSRSLPVVVLAVLTLAGACQHAGAGASGSPAVTAPGQGEAAERRQAFVLADIDGDGCLSLAEVARELAWRFAALDANHDDLLTPDELGEHDSARFARIDKNGDGRLTFVEVMQVKQADFAAADKDKSNCVMVVEVLDFDGLK